MAHKPGDGQRSSRPSTSSIPIIGVLGLLPSNTCPRVSRRPSPSGFDGICGIEVKEATDGDKVISGRAYIAPGNRHTLVRRLGPSYFLEVRDGSLVSCHRPSVSVLFRSVAQAAGPSAVGVLMTGMGDDGADGLLEMKQAEALTIAQDEASCVVFGMPREAIARGAEAEILPLFRIPGAILRRRRFA